MKKIVAIFAFLVFMTGCANDNKITINNLSMGSLRFNFRAAQYTIEINEIKTIADIPNGQFEYNTTFGLPSGAETWTVEGDAGSGNLTFEKRSTQYLLIYSAVLSKDANYKLFVNKTSTKSGTSPTGP